MLVTSTVVVVVVCWSVVMTPGSCVGVIVVGVVFVSVVVVGDGILSSARLISNRLYIITSK